MIKYRKLFLNKIKSLFSYLAEFSEDKSMLPKKYSNNCAIGSLNQRPIIMITYDKSSFSANNSQKSMNS